ncbi:hypothetical protein LTR62_006921 [Meristemomyces frigidus]|uniref:Pyridoxamine 5'-phosphate oxidase N-terminal domain-containing protein n=1 Tax=Meristemomyces frigidus TaxID=1508187 RepID=A0AAN7TJI3_9PEZI|nr:hypothetical protein LTR62_006921 [Meristemomyces frigidus]
MADAQTPLTWQGSAASNPTIADQLPEEVITCLQNARFLHLATCNQNRPHVSLMNYTYLPQQPTHIQANHHPNLPNGPLIIMTTNPSSRKTLNLQQNPSVSLLVHDWVSSRPPTTNTDSRDRSPAGARSSSLAAMLMQMNSAAVSSISATINGEASVLALGSEEEIWCKRRHLENNTFDPANGEQGLWRTSSHEAGEGDGGRESYIEGEDVRVVVVRITDGRISDWKGGVKDFCLSGAAEATGSGTEGMVNGVR